MSFSVENLTVLQPNIREIGNLKSLEIKMAELLSLDTH